MYGVRAFLCGCTGSPCLLSTLHPSVSAVILPRSCISTVQHCSPYMFLLSPSCPVLRDWNKSSDRPHLHPCELLAPRRVPRLGPCPYNLHCSYCTVMCCTVSSPVQDLMAEPLLGLSAGAQRMDAAAAAAGAQGVLVKDILSAEEELRVSEGGMHSSDVSLGGRLWTMPSVAKCCKLLHACSWMLCTQ